MPLCLSVHVLHEALSTHAYWLTVVIRTNSEPNPLQCGGPIRWIAPALLLSPALCCTGNYHRPTPEHVSLGESTDRHLDTSRR